MDRLQSRQSGIAEPPKRLDGNSGVHYVGLHAPTARNVLRWLERKPPRSDLENVVQPALVNQPETQRCHPGKSAFLVIVFPDPQPISGCAGGEVVGCPSGSLLPTCAGYFTHPPAFFGILGGNYVRRFSFSLQDGLGDGLQRGKVGCVHPRTPISPTRSALCQLRAFQR